MLGYLLNLGFARGSDWLAYGSGNRTAAAAPSYTRTSAALIYKI